MTAAATEWLSFEEAARLGPLVRLNAARCPQHGPVTPEAYCYPLSASPEALQFMADEGSTCLGRGCESDIEVDAEPASRSLHQHLVLWYGDTIEERQALGFDPGKPRVVCELTPVWPGEYMQGVPLRAWYDSYGEPPRDG